MVKECKYFVDQCYGRNYFSHFAFNVNKPNHTVRNIHKFTKFLFYKGNVKFDDIHVFM